jgi:hypothetical protein
MRTLMIFILMRLKSTSSKQCFVVKVYGMPVFYPMPGLLSMLTNAKLFAAIPWFAMLMGYQVITKNSQPRQKHCFYNRKIFD